MWYQSSRLILGNKKNNSINKCNFFLSSVSVYLQTGEYATDEEEEMSPVFPNSIEVFDLAENQDMSPVELDPEKLAHKFKEVYKCHSLLICSPIFSGRNCIFVFILCQSVSVCSSR